MFTAVVHRKQHAVGHGGFHVGRITVRKDEVQLPQLMLFESSDAQGKSTKIFEKLYVYDCGSESPHAFERAIRSHRLTSDGGTDLLFVSHLDSDHINKLDRLMGVSPAKIVILPYLDAEDLSELLIREVDEGDITGSLRAYASDPVQWWRLRGADTIIFIESGNGEDQAPTGGPPDTGIDPDGLPRSESEGASVRLTCVLRKPRGDAPKGFAVAKYETPNDVDRDLPAGGVLAGSASHFRIEWQTEKNSPWRYGDWILAPYVHPVEARRRREFRDAIMRELGLSNPQSDEFAAALLEKLRSHRRTLVALYSKHFEVGQNAISMSLYSGPQRLGGGSGTSDWRVPVRQLEFGYEMTQSPVGWLKTGDSKLKQSDRRDPWLRFFNPHTYHIHILSLPHHGSFKDFHEDILKFDALKIAIATTIRDRNRVARLEDTLSEVEAAKKNYAVVDDQSENAFDIACARFFSPV